ncbi:MAG: hypothetical protein IT372_24530 [Polyangiaceae bacterium]|nr:hypothetical protein [Polyangiaceae bacterium]
MGERQTRALLLPCIGWARAAQAAEGWGGDAFTVLSSPEGARAALWSTAWDTEADAGDFERAISASHACLPALGFEAAPTAPARVVRDGARVAVALALPPAQLAPAATALLELPEPPLPLAPPVGEVTLPPLAPALRPSLGALRGSAYASAWLGLAALVPQGFSARVGHEGTELFMERPGALGLFGLSDRIVSPQANERLLDELAAGFAAGAEVTLVPSQTMSYSLPIGAVIARRWEIPNTSAQLAVVIAAIWWDTGAYVFLTMSATPEAQAALDAWLLSFRATTPAPPVCAELAPE